MTIAYRLDGALLPYQSVRFNPAAEAAFPSTAWYTEADIAGVIIEDPNGTLDIDGWHTFTVEETACSKPRIFTGWVVGRAISRGRDSNRTGAARVLNCDIIDQNAVFLLEVFRSTAASVRPAETDVARIQAMIASHAMAGTPIYDNGRLSTADPVNISGANFVTQYPADMAMATAGQCGKNVYAYWDESADQISIHYDAVGSGPAATISFSNVPGDFGPIESASTTCFAPSRDAVMTADPYNLYTGFLMGYVGGFEYQRNATLIDALSPSEFSPVNFLRDKYYNTSAIGEVATAQAYTSRYLTDHGVEKVTITFSAILPARAVNLAHAGDIVTVRFSHLPGFTSNTEIPIVRRSVRPVDGHDALYEVTFECANFNGASAGGGDPGELPPQPCDATTDVFLGAIGGPDNNYSPFFENAWFDGDDTSIGVVIGFIDLYTWTTGAEETITSALIKWSYGDIHPGEGAAASFRIEGGPTQTGPWTTVFSDSDPPGTAGVVYPEDFENEYTFASATYLWWRWVNQTANNNDVKTISAFGPCDDPCPLPGQPSREDEEVTPTPDGTTTTFFTACPFADDTLHVKVDDTNQTGALASFDGAAGSFTFNSAPLPGMYITVNYIGRQ